IARWYRVPSLTNIKRRFVMRKSLVVLSVLLNCLDLAFAGEYSVPTPASHPVGITRGLDGNLWFTEFTASKMRRVTPAGVITEFALPNANSYPYDITLGPDGNLWFTEDNGNRIGRITSSGILTEFPVPTPLAGPAGICAGPDGNLWFVEEGVNRIG